jgi:hypothetical protein
MYDIVDTETGEVYGSYKTADEAFGWMEKNCAMSEVYNWFGNIECIYYYNGNLVEVVIN